MHKQYKFIQISNTERSLTALDANGEIWTYFGNKYGWKKLNMTRMTVAQEKQARKKKEIEQASLFTETD